MTLFKIKPSLPPELDNYHGNESALENKSCINFLREHGVSRGTLLNWSPGMKQKKVSIFIPTADLTGTPIVIKFLYDVKNHVMLADQSFEQIHNLDLFIASTGLPVTEFELNFLFVDVIEEDKKCESTDTEQIKKIKQGLLSKCKNGGFKIIRLKKVDHTATNGGKMSFRNTTPRKSQVLTDFLNDAASDARSSSSSAIIKQLVSSVPRHSYLQFSEQNYNSSDNETNNGFTLNNVEKVNGTFARFFQQCAEEEVCIFPEFDLARNSVLEQTNEKTGYLDVRRTNDFTGEEVDFVERVLGRLKEPRGLLIRDYNRSRLNNILRDDYTLNFQFDWVLFSQKKLYGIEVSRSDNVKNPNETVYRKIASVFSTSLPKFKYILASMLYNASKQFTSEERRNFLEHGVSFIIYFANISVTKINRVLENLTSRESAVTKDDLKNEALAELELTPNDVKQKIFVMCSGDPVLYKKAPDLYNFACKDSVWYLKQSKITTQSIFCRQKSIPCNKMVQYVSGLFTFGFLIVNHCIEKQKLLTWNEKIISEKSKFQKRIPHPRLILSPQQLRILKENKKRIYIVGEPGTGKTMLLLAKMCAATNDINVDHVLFFHPDAKNDFRKFLEKFIEESIERKDKIHLVTSSQIRSTVRNFNLRRTVVLGDEFYFDPNNDFAASNSSSFLRSTNFLSWVPQTKQCWLANTEAGQDNKKNIHRLTLPHFYTETLNVLFRCSWHIGRFCTLVLHQNIAISKSSAWVFGCTKSSQNKVFYDYYTDWNSLNESIRLCGDLRSKFDHDRMTVIFSSAGNEGQWYMHLSKNQSKIGRIFVINNQMGFYDLPFTGIEKKSVLLIIDSSDGSENETLKYSLAASRAQFELCILANHRNREQLEPFLNKCEPTVFDDIVTSARLGLPVDLNEIVEQQPELLTARISTLLHIAVQRQNLDLVQAIAQHFRADLEKIDILQVFMAMDKPKGRTFLTRLGKIFGKMIAFHFEEVISRVHRQLPEDQPFINSIVDMLNIAARMGLLVTVDWIIDFIGEKARNFFAQQSAKIIFYACNNGSFEAIKWAITKTEQCGSLQREMEETYSTWSGERVTLLLFLCHMNIDDMKPIQILREKKFPVKLLRNQFEGMNVLQKALFYKNLQMAQELLKDDLWAQKLIPSKKELIRLSQKLESNKREAVDVELLNLLNERFQATHNSK